MNTPPSKTRVRVHPAFTAAVAILHAAALIFAIILAIYEVGHHTSGVKRESPFDDGTQTMRAEDFFDLERTHKPTEEEVLEIKSRIQQQWEQIVQQWEQAGSPEVDFYAYADKLGIDLITFADVVEAIGRPHQFNPYTGMRYIDWETTNGKEYGFTFGVPENVIGYGDSVERDLWLYEHYGIA